MQNAMTALLILCCVMEQRKLPLLCSPSIVVGGDARMLELFKP